MDNQELRSKTISGMFWSFVDNFSRQGISFIVGIILARLLTPAEFGVIGLVTIFIALAQTFIESGFTQALIRKKDCTNEDYSTVFIFNLVISIVLYLILYFSSPAIGRFFDEPDLPILLKFLGLGMIIGSFSIIQRVILTKQLNFKLQTQITLIASGISGLIGIIMAYQGYGVWSLAVRIIGETILISFFLMVLNKWLPSLLFNFKAFKELFSFGGKLLASSLIDVLYKNIYFAIIGKYFSTADLGYYTRAEQFQKLPTQNLTSVIQRVSFPVLSKIQNDNERLRETFTKLIKNSMFISFILTLGLASIADALILTLLGEKWEQSIIFLQLLCIVGMLYPMHAMNLNLLNVLGHSGKFLKLEIYKKIIIIPTIIIGIKYGIIVLILGMVFNSIVAFFLNAYFSKELINYSSISQLKDVSKSFFLALTMSLLVYVYGVVIPLGNPMRLFTQILLGGFLIISLSEIFQHREYLYLKNMFLSKLKQ